MHGDGTDECFTSIVPYDTAEKKQYVSSSG